MTTIELKFVKFSGEHYTLFYRLKEFIPEEIMPKSFLCKILRNVFNIKKLTRNNWVQVYEFCYPKNLEQWIYDEHPGNWVQLFLVKFSQINTIKEKFKTLEDIQEFNKSENDHYNKRCEQYEYRIEKLKNIIY